MKEGKTVRKYHARLISVNEEFAKYVTQVISILPRRESIKSNVLLLSATSKMGDF